MALFGGQRDAKFLAAINSELINAVIDTEIEFYKLVVESSNSNMYGESENKSYYDSILIPCLIAKDDKNSNMDDYGHTYTRSSKFAIARDILVKSDFYPEVGDIVFWDNEYFEVDNVDANQYFAGKNPETWPNGDSHGYSVSILVDAHATRQTPQGIRDIRFGGNNNSPTYKEH
jgi:hypothetical protein|tara:strand:+ start:2649 stop:3170 length:522 start_codon:yes stop_codon:yes gene_type:complete